MIQGLKRRTGRETRILSFLCDLRLSLPVPSPKVSTASQKRHLEIKLLIPGESGGIKHTSYSRALVSHSTCLLIPSLSAFKFDIEEKVLLPFKDQA